MHVHISNFGIFEMQFKCFKFVNLVWQQNTRSEFDPWSTEEIKLAWNKDKKILAEPGTDLNLVQYLLYSMLSKGKYSYKMYSGAVTTNHIVILEILL